MLYESAARADEVLCLNVEDLYPQDKRGKITAKGGATEWIHWQSGTAQLLPRLIAGRTHGPLFLTGRKAPAGTATLNVCEETSRARLSYRRAEEIFEESTRLLANPLARPEDVEDLEGWGVFRLPSSPRATRRRTTSVRWIWRTSRATPGCVAALPHPARRLRRHGNQAGPPASAPPRPTGHGR
ncbi:DNA polymerase Y subunit UmuC family protein [Streptomyces griseiscabiei]|nr:site-specific integrase [Streptomyces griseiscabiei]